MFAFVLAIHLILCLGMIFLVLLQQGKGADLGAAFGGGSSSLFGAAGAGNVLTRLTTGIAISFMVTSVLLVKLSQDPESMVEGVSSRSVAPAADDRLEGSVLERLPIDEPTAVPATPAAGAAVPPAIPPVVAPGETAAEPNGTTAAQPVDADAVNATPAAPAPSAAPDSGGKPAQSNADSPASTVESPAAPAGTAPGAAAASGKK